MPEYKTPKFQHLERGTSENDYEGEYSPYKKLAAAIILQAVRDYRRIKHNRKNHYDVYTLEELERFFKSGWFETLSNMDGERCLDQLRNEDYNIEKAHAHRYCSSNLNFTKHNKR